MNLLLRERTRIENPKSSGEWKILETVQKVPATSTAILICDMWDYHPCQPALARCQEMAGKMNQAVALARNNGVFIIHSPSGCMGAYAGTPQRQRMTEAPHVEPPKLLDIQAPEFPLGTATNHGCDGVWDWDHGGSLKMTRQTPLIEIAEEDGISDNGTEVYNFMQQHGIIKLLIMGVHTNMCVMGRSFGIQQMVKWQVGIALVRDLTDAMYNPVDPPYVSHDKGTELMIEYIEKYWCPSIPSDCLLN
jgi:nicotinamidase-related amidase